MRYYTGIGSRTTPSNILREMESIAKAMSRLGFTLRSGGAGGADKAFENGSSDSEIILPWKGFNGASGIVYTSSPESVASVNDLHPCPSRLSVGAFKCIERDYFQVAGLSGEPVSEFVVCWTSDGKASGGTGQAIRVAESLGVPVYNLFNISDKKALIARIRALNTEAGL